MYPAWHVYGHARCSVCVVVGVVQMTWAELAPGVAQEGPPVVQEPGPLNGPFAWQPVVYWPAPHGPAHDTQSPVAGSLYWVE